MNCCYGVKQSFHNMPAILAGIVLSKIAAKCYN